MRDHAFFLIMNLSKIAGSEGSANTTRRSAESDPTHRVTGIDATAPRYGFKTSFIARVASLGGRIAIRRSRGLRFIE